MKKILLGATVCLSMFTSVVNAQNIKPCATYDAIEYFKKTMPGYKERLETIEKNKMSAQRTASLSPTDTITIPVVFHVLHQNGAENISSSVLTTAIDNVNKDFARLGTDTASIHPSFKALYVNSFIKFVIASKDPNGNCTDGIVRHYDANTNWKQSDILNTYKYSTLAPGSWRPDKYLNIYIVKNIIDNGSSAGIIVGYTYIPGTAPVPASDAIVYRYDFLNSYIDTRSLSHEIGHWLGLSHTFGSTNSPGQACGDDGILDTPPTVGFFSTCPATPSGTVICNGQFPNVQNIMDYSACPRNFTQGQTDVMRAAATDATAGRSTLTSTANLVATGVLNNTPTPCAPIADFVGNKSITCAGQNVTFSDLSYNGSVSNYAWTFEGGTPATSTNSSESVTYSTPGVYGVTLTVSNAQGSNTVTKTSYINTTWNSDYTAIPYTESFESGLPAMWTAKNTNANSPGFTSVNYGSQGSSKSIALENFGKYAPSHVDILESGQFDFSNVTSVAISFDYSYARTTAATSESFALQYSKDCGGTWTNVPGTPNAAALAASGGTINTGAFYPWPTATPSKWVTKAIPSSILGTLNNTRDVKFRFYFQNDAGGETNNLYIDNINISGVVGLHELENTIALSIFPNPTSSSATVEFTSPVNSNVAISVVDVTGRLVETSTFKAGAGVKSQYNVNANDQLNSGIYFVTISLDGQTVTKKVIID